MDLANALETLWSQTTIVENTDLPEPCWLHSGFQARGHAYLTYEGCWWRVHRLGWVASGNILEVGKELHHVCAFKHCWQPQHLLQLTRKEHMHLDGRVNAFARLQTWKAGVPAAAKAKKAKMTCPHGHPYDMIKTDASGTRRGCKTCRRNADLRFKAKQKERRLQWQG